MKDSTIQWCDDTVNPVMGCKGCELWPSSVQHISNRLDAVFKKEMGECSVGEYTDTIKSVLGNCEVDQIARIHKDIARCLARALHKDGDTALIGAIEQEFAVIFSCYAGASTAQMDGHSTGFPTAFDRVTLFPGRMAEAAGRKDLTGTSRAKYPWRNGLPRLIFVSDMGDALSTVVPFEYLKSEIIDVVTSPKGQRHLWLWLTKRDLRMVEFDGWLAAMGVPWPDNLVAMTTITSNETLHRARTIAKVRAKLKGLSIEPLWEKVTVPLDGINWVIVGGGSGDGAKPFDQGWAYDLRDQCGRAGVAFFMKQLGAEPMGGGKRIQLKDAHGGEWDEWPRGLRIREFPTGFHRTQAVSLETAKSEPSK